MPLAPRHAIGVMTGTSLDGIDAALVRAEGRGVDMTVTLLASRSAPLGEPAEDLRAAAEQTPMTAHAFASLARRFAARIADVIEPLAASPALERAAVDLVAVHGQTIVHAPPLSWQILNPAPIAARLGAPVMSDFRQADLAVGGEGAPITPIADWVLYRGAPARTIVNLGGFVNLTALPPASSDAPLDRIHGADVCACNHVLDGLARTRLDAPFDKDGRAALSGRPDPLVVDQLRTELAREARRSLGTGDECIERARTLVAPLAPEDALASAVRAIAEAVAGALPGDTDEVLLAGGGTRNRALVASLVETAHRPVRLTDDVGPPAALREAVAMAVLGLLSLDRVPITLPRVTGCAARSVAGTLCNLRSQQP